MARPNSCISAGELHAMQQEYQAQVQNHLRDLQQAQQDFFVQQQAQQNQFLQGAINMLPGALQAAVAPAPAPAPVRGVQERPMEGDPAKLLSLFDFATQGILKKARKDVETRIERLFEQKELADKYAKLDQEGSMHKDFVHDAGKQWQFAKEYEAAARPSPVEQEVQNKYPEDFTDMEGKYNVQTAWERLRKFDARQCWHFCKWHQEQYTATLEVKSKVEAVCTELMDQLTSMMMRNAEYYAMDDQQQRAVERAQLWMGLVLRNAITTTTEIRHRKLENDRVQAEKLAEATAKYEAMDAKEFLASLVLEAQGLAKAGEKKEHTKQNIRKDSALGTLIALNNNLANDYGLSISYHGKKFPAMRGSSRTPSKPTSQRSKSQRSQISRTSSKASSRGGTVKSFMSESVKSVVFADKRGRSKGSAGSKSRATPRPQTPQTDRSRRGRSRDPSKNGAKGEGKGSRKGRKT
mmetsp:Transcript_37106/g.106855  ORF Transcript_37106/g.106855 Transcript_37106/m.106855 type:complete len:465 (+) Transcript_37106:3783-5177(+)